MLSVIAIDSIDDKYVFATFVCECDGSGEAGWASSDDEKGRFGW
jgi:hypothetical protein